MTRTLRRGMKAKLWDEYVHDYLDVKIPDSCRHHGHDLDEIVTCPSCGARLRDGSCYASRRFFTQTVSSSLAVCPACHEKEYGK